MLADMRGRVNFIATPARMRGSIEAPHPQGAAQSYT